MELRQDLIGEGSVRVQKADDSLIFLRKFLELVKSPGRG